MKSRDPLTEALKTTLFFPSWIYGIIDFLLGMGAYVQRYVTLKEAIVVGLGIYVLLMGLSFLALWSDEKQKQKSAKKVIWKRA